MIDVGQLFLKTGLTMRAVDFFQLSSILLAATNPYILIGLALVGGSSIFWLNALSKTDLSLAYPMLSLGFVIVSVASYFLFNEQLTLLRMVGIGVISSGVFLMARS